MAEVIDEKITSLLREASEWRLISLLFECPSEEWLAQITALGGEVADPVLRESASQALDQSGEGLYHSAFGPGGPAPPREVSYSDSVQLGYLVAELEAYYGAFGFHPVTAEPCDHVSIETAFLSFLRVKEAYARLTGDIEQAVLTAEAAGNFLRDHLSWMAEPLSARLNESGIGYLAAVGRALLERVGPSRPRMALPRPFPVIPEETEFDCSEAP